MNLGWFDCWTAPKIKLDISFLYHPVPIGGPAPQAEISTPEKENKLLSPLRVPSRISRSATRQVISRNYNSKINIKFLGQKI